MRRCRRDSARVSPSALTVPGPPSFTKASVTSVPSVNSRTAVHASGGFLPGPALDCGRSPACGALAERGQSRFRASGPRTPKVPERRDTKTERPAVSSSARSSRSLRIGCERSPDGRARATPSVSTLDQGDLKSSLMSISRKRKETPLEIAQVAFQPGKQLPIPDSSRVETGFPAVVRTRFEGSAKRRTAATFRAISLGD